MPHRCMQPAHPFRCMQPFRPVLRMQASHPSPCMQPANPIHCMPPSHTHHPSSHRMQPPGHHHMHHQMWQCPHNRTSRSTQHRPNTHTPALITSSTPFAVPWLTFPPSWPLAPPYPTPPGLPCHRSPSPPLPRHIPKKRSTRRTRRQTSPWMSSRPWKKRPWARRDRGSRTRHSPGPRCTGR